MRPVSNLSRLLALTLLGAATTVAVAWSIALRRIPFDDIMATPANASRASVVVEHTISNQTEAFIFDPMSSGWGWTYIKTARRHPTRRLDGERDHSKLPHVDRFPVGYPVPLEGPNTRTDIRFGWPSRAMFAMHLMHRDANSMRTPGWSHAYIPSPTSGTVAFLFQRHDSVSSFPTPPHAVPTGILPHGFAINTAFYAALWLIALVGLKRTRQQIRTWRGLCRKCAYSRAGLPSDAPCPECGSARHRTRLKAASLDRGS